MIIELFGPPGAGKTTFAHRLAARLAAKGADVALPLRFVQGQHGYDHRIGLAAGARRGGSAALNLLAGTRRAIGADAARLMDILPPRSLVWRMRMRQYLARLQRAWDANGQDQVAIYDQAFVQAVCSLAALGGRDDEATLWRALAAVPKADIVVRLELDRESLIERLRARLRSETLVERMLEADIELNLKIVGIAETVDAHLGACGARVIHCDTRDPRSVEAALAAVETAAAPRAPVPAATKVAHAQL